MPVETKFGRDLATVLGTNLTQHRLQLGKPQYKSPSFFRKSLKLWQQNDKNTRDLFRDIVPIRSN